MTVGSGGGHTSEGGGGEGMKEGGRRQRLKWGKGKDGRKVGAPFTRAAVDLLAETSTHERPWHQYGDRDGAAWKRFASRLRDVDIFQGYSPDPGPMRTHIMGLIDQAGVEDTVGGVGPGSRGGAGRSHRAELNAMQKVLRDLRADREEAMIARSYKGKGKRPAGGGDNERDGVLPTAQAPAADGVSGSKRAKTSDWPAVDRERIQDVVRNLDEAKKDLAILLARANARIDTLEGEVKRLWDALKSHGHSSEQSAGGAGGSSKAEAPRPAETSRKRK